MKLTRIGNPQSSSLLHEHIEELQVFPRHPCKPPINFVNRKASQIKSKYLYFIPKTKNPEISQGLKHTQRRWINIRKEYHSKIDLVGAGVRKESLSNTINGVQWSRFHVVPPAKVPGCGWAWNASSCRTRCHEFPHGDPSLYLDSSVLSLKMKHLVRHL